MSERLSPESTQLATRMDPRYQQAAEALRRSKTTIAVTGAGISVESGIPDFRSPGGIWDRYPPEEFATIQAFHTDPDRVWSMWYELSEMLSGAKPNAAHAALAAMQRQGRLSSIITQNIDNLHQEAGSTQVVEYHGNGHWIRCLACGNRVAWILLDKLPTAPRCACGGIMKPDIVLFGELIPSEALDTAEAVALAAEAVIVVGTSGAVYPAAGIPFAAKERGAFILECNIEPTEFTASITDVFLQGRAGETLPLLLQALDLHPE